MKLAAVPDPPRHAAPVATATHLDTPPDDERGAANYDERGAYDGTGLLIAIACDRGHRLRHHLADRPLTAAGAGVCDPCCSALGAVRGARRLRWSVPSTLQAALR